MKPKPRAFVIFVVFSVRPTQERKITVSYAIGHNLKYLLLIILRAFNASS